jgi:hypothetical protein
MKFEYISTARTQAVSDLNILMYSPDGVRQFKATIETGSNANQVAHRLEQLAKEIREKAQPLPFRVY